MSNFITKKDLESLDFVNAAWTEYSRVVRKILLNIPKELNKIDNPFENYFDNKLHDVAFVVPENEWDNFNDFCEFYWENYKEDVDVEFKPLGRTSSFYIVPSQTGNYNLLEELYIALGSENKLELVKTLMNNFVNEYDSYPSTKDEFFDEIIKDYDADYDKDYFYYFFNNYYIHEMIEDLEDAYDEGLDFIETEVEKIKHAVDLLNNFKSNQIKYWRSFNSDNFDAFELSSDEIKEISELAFKNLMKPGLTRFSVPIDNRSVTFEVPLYYYKEILSTETSSNHQGNLIGARFKDIELATTLTLPESDDFKDYKFEITFKPNVFDSSIKIIANPNRTGNYEAQCKINESFRFEIKYWNDKIKDKPLVTSVFWSVNNNQELETVGTVN